jgi:hypothetical protein
MTQKVMMSQSNKIKKKLQVNILDLGDDNKTINLIGSNYLKSIHKVKMIFLGVNSSHN